MYDTLRPWLFKLDAELAHRAALYALGVAQRSDFAQRLVHAPPAMSVRAFGIDFPNPVGLAAGLDKNGEYVDALAALGFGFIEIGTVTPRPQRGNPKPRLFRLPEHDAIINRMGFNNDGIDALMRNLDDSEYDGVLGINIGRNKDTPNERAADDYAYCLGRVHERASYVVVNVSSPNTEGLRDLQQGEALRRLLGHLREECERLATRTPLLVKIAPDLDAAAMDAMAAALREAGIDGVICGNTSTDHSSVASAEHGGEAGGLSGRPLFARSTEVLRAMAERLDGALPLIGVGGIMEGGDAAEKLDAGATLVQLYSGLIYRGPALVAECAEEIVRQHGSADAR